MFAFFLRRIHFLRALLYLVLGLMLLATAGMASAKPTNVTDAEMSLLPRYCPDTMGFKYGDAYSNTSPRASHWVALMGKGFWHMHHYCWAQINLSRSRRAGTPEQMRKALWESVRGDYLYVINNTAADFVMLPEIYSRLGEVELLLAQPKQANEAFAKSRQLKPDYWPAYSHWAEFLMKTGRRSEALKVVASGLAHSPDAKVLLELFRLLGGKPSDIPKPPEKPLAQSNEANEDAPSKTDSQAVSDSERSDK